MTKPAGLPGALGVRRARHWASVCLVLLVGSGTDASASNPVASSQASGAPTVEALPDGAYRCRPGGAGPFAGILYNHGGLGDAVGGDLEGVCRSFAEIGYIAWSQRRPSSMSLNGQLESVLEGFEALRAETTVDPNRLGIIGFSRGGLLTLQAATRLGGGGGCAWHRPLCTCPWKSRIGTHVG